MHSLIGEYDSRWCFSYLPKRAPRSKGLLTVLPKPISLPKPITLNLLCIFVTTSLLKIRISPWWMLNKTTLLSHILLTFNKLLCKFAPKINVSEPLSLERRSLGWVEAGGGEGARVRWSWRAHCFSFSMLTGPSPPCELVPIRQMAVFREVGCSPHSSTGGGCCKWVEGEKKNGKDSSLN